MPLTEVTVKSENATYVGVSLVDFCNRTGIFWDAGLLKIKGANGQSATLDMFQAWNSTYYPYDQNFNVIVLAFATNGQWITSATGGPVKLIAPDFASNYQVQQVAEIHSQPWSSFHIQGKLRTRLLSQARTITDFQSETLHGEFRPGDEPNRTSDWTGIPILQILQVAKASSQAKQVSIIGIDGYTQNFTLRPGQGWANAAWLPRKWAASSHQPRWTLQAFCANRPIQVGNVLGKICKRDRGMLKINQTHNLTINLPSTIFKSAQADFQGGT